IHYGLAGLQQVTILLLLDASSITDATSAPAADSPVPGAPSGREQRAGAGPQGLLCVQAGDPRNLHGVEHHTLGVAARLVARRAVSEKNRDRPLGVGHHETPVPQQRRLRGAAEALAISARADAERALH